MTSKNNKKTADTSSSSNKGASMDPEKQRENAGKGGKGSHKNDNSGTKNPSAKNK